MSTIHKRRNGRPLASVSNNQAIRSPHGAIDIVGEVGGVMDGGEHTGLHLFLFHILPGQQKILKEATTPIIFYFWPEFCKPTFIFCVRKQTNLFLSIFILKKKKIVWKFQFFNSISTNVNGKEHKCLNFDQLTLVVLVWRKDVTSGEIVTTPRFPRAQPLAAAAFLSWRTNIFMFWICFALKFLFFDSRSVF